MHLQSVLVPIVQKSSQSVIQCLLVNLLRTPLILMSKILLNLDFLGFGTLRKFSMFLYPVAIGEMKRCAIERVVFGVKENALPLTLGVTPSKSFPWLTFREPTHVD